MKKWNLIQFIIGGALTTFAVWAAMAGAPMVSVAFTAMAIAFALT